MKHSLLIFKTHLINVSSDLLSSSSKEKENCTLDKNGKTSNKIEAISLLSFRLLSNCEHVRVILGTV